MLLAWRHPWAQATRRAAPRLDTVRDSGLVMTDLYYLLVFGNEQNRGYLIGDYPTWAPCASAALSPSTT